MNAPTPPRRFRFGLRTLFVVVTVVAVGCWVANSLYWIRQRHEMLEVVAAMTYPSEDDPTMTAPGCLWLFGEKGVAVVFVFSADQNQMEQLSCLFPEAEIRPAQ